MFKTNKTLLLFIMLFMLIGCKTTNTTSSTTSTTSNIDSTITLELKYEWEEDLTALMEEKYNHVIPSLNYNYSFVVVEDELTISFDALINFHNYIELLRENNYYLIEQDEGNEEYKLLYFANNGLLTIEILTNFQIVLSFQTINLYSEWPSITADILQDYTNFILPTLTGGICYNIIENNILSIIGYFKTLPILEDYISIITTEGFEVITGNSTSTLLGKDGENILINVYYQEIIDLYKIGIVITPVSID